MSLSEKKDVILVTGATGAVGPRVVEHLHRSGYRIRTFSLDMAEKGIFPPGVQVLQGDVTMKKELESAVEGVDGVLHLAALLHITNPSPALRDRYTLINVGGTQNVVDAALNAGAKRIVFFSTIAVYGNSGGKIIDEDCPLNPDTYYGITKRKAEEIVLGARDREGRPIGTVLRLAAVYGSRIKGNYEQLAKALSRNRFVPIGKGSNRRTLVYDEDVARAAMLALGHPDAAGRTYNVSDGTFHTLEEILGSICSGLGRKPPRFSLPVMPVRAAAKVVEGVSSLLRTRKFVTVSMVDKYTEDVAVAGVRIRKELGFLPSFDLEAGWVKTIGELRDSGAI